MAVYLSLFISAFLSATLLPGSSEILLLALAQQNYDPWVLWAWASAGNTLGSVVNWLLGRFLLHGGRGERRLRMALSRLALNL